MLKLDYSPNQGQNLRGQIALLTDFYADYQRQLTDPMRLILNEAGFGLTVVAGRALPNSGEGAVELVDDNAIYNLIQQADTAGVIIVTGIVCCGLGPTSLISFANGFGDTPMVCLGVEVPGRDSLILDNATGMNQCLDYLIERDKTCAYMFIGGRENNPDSLEREAVFRDRLAQANIPIDEELIYYADYLSSNTYRFVTETIPKRPDVVCGFDDSFETTNHSITLSTVTQPHVEIAKRAAQMLINNITGARKTRHIENITTEFIPRESTGYGNSRSNKANHETTKSQKKQCDDLVVSIICRIRQPQMRTSIPPQVLQKCLSAAANNDPTPFENEIEKRFDTKSLSRYDLHWWQNLVVAIEDRAGQLEKTIHLDRLQSSLLAGIQTIHDGIKECLRRIEFDAERIVQINDQFLDQVAMVKHETDIGQPLLEWSEALAITRCFFVLYEMPTIEVGERAHLLSYLLDGEMLHKQLDDGLLVMLPIHSGNIQFGYILFDPSSAPIRLMYEKIVASIGNTLRLIMQFEQMQVRTNDLMRANKELTTLANFDKLTNLPNRVFFQNSLTKAFDKANHCGTEVGLLFIDLDGFKLINDTLGHDAGDFLLRIVAERLTKALGSSCLVSRLGGDEFTIIIEATENAQGEATQIANTVLQTLSEPYELTQIVVNVSASIGIACFPRHAKNVENMMRKADTAMYHAKGSGKNCTRVYTDELDAQFAFQLRQDQDMRKGLHDDEFLLYFQPKYSLATATLVGAEALLRWKPNKHLSELVTPDNFIPIAEQTGFITELDQFALNRACETARKWFDNGHMIPVAVNMSTVQFRQPHFVAEVASFLNKHNLDPSLLELEVTESAAMDDVEQSIQQLTELRNLGIKLSIDDFGTGYSSLNYLKRLPVDSLKIDKSFLHGLKDDNDDTNADKAIILAIIALGKTMGFNIIAEGIEHEHQQAVLNRMGCHEGQGYYFSRPVSEAEFAQLLASNCAHNRAA